MQEKDYDEKAAYVIEETKDTVHKHFNRMLDAVMKNTDDNVVWIGEENSQYAENQEQFKDIFKREYKEKPCILNRESYRVAAHDSNLWVVCGTAVATGKNSSKRLFSKAIRFTFVWSHCNNEWKILHAHMSRDCTDSCENVASWCINNESAISLKATDKKIYSICPQDVLYAKSEGQYCQIYLKDGKCVVSRISLSDTSNIFGEDFIRVHRSYGVNAAFIVECKYMKIMLSDGTVIPCSRDKFSIAKKAAAQYKIKLIEK